MAPEIGPKSFGGFEKRAPGHFNNKHAPDLQGKVSGLHPAQVGLY